MGLAFWRVYHEQQQKAAAEAELTKESLKKISPLLALQQDPKQPEKAPEQPQEASPATTRPVSPQSHSRLSRTRKPQED